METYDVGDIRGVVVTLRGTSDNACVDERGHVYDFVSRNFAPWVGIPEDPVTGRLTFIPSPRTHVSISSCIAKGGGLSFLDYVLHYSFNPYLQIQIIYTY